jgi:hypothetical protein
MYDDEIIAKFYGIKEYENRSSLLKKTVDGFLVEMYDDNQFVQSRQIIGKSIHYCRDAAENWIIGVIP